MIVSILFGLVSMVAYGLANAFSKPLSQKLGAAQTLFLRGFSISLILAIAAIPSFHYFSHWTVALAAVGLGIVGYLPVLAFTHGIKETPLGIMAPIAGTSPLITVILSFVFLSVFLKPAQWVAIVLVVAANIAISVDLRNWRQSNFLHKSSGIPFALAAALGWGLFYFFLVPVSKTIGPWLAALLVEVGVTIAAGLHVKLSGQKTSLRKALQPQIIWNGVLICLGTVVFTVGVRYYNVGIVAALSNSTALVSTILGVCLFHERIHAKERIAAAVMIIGIAALTLL
jgi:drug/metabolite transporter (DMT)-like permease